MLPAMPQGHNGRMSRISMGESASNNVFLGSPATEWLNVNVHIIYIVVHGPTWPHFPIPQCNIMQSSTERSCRRACRSGINPPVASGSRFTSKGPRISLNPDESGPQIASVHFWGEKKEAHYSGIKGLGYWASKSRDFLGGRNQQIEYSIWWGLQVFVRSTSHLSIHQLVETLTWNILQSLSCASDLVVGT